MVELSCTQEAVSPSPDPRLLGMLFLRGSQGPGLAARRPVQPQQEGQSTSSHQMFPLVSPVSSSSSPGATVPIPHVGPLSSMASLSAGGPERPQGGLSAGFQSPPKPRAGLDVAGVGRVGGGLYLGIRHYPSPTGWPGDNDGSSFSVKLLRGHTHLARSSEG